MLLLVAGDADVDVLAGPEGQRLVALDPQAQRADVVGQRLDRRHARLTRADRAAAVDDVLVVVDQLDLEVGVGMGAAQQRPALGLLEVGQRERRVAVEVDVAVQQEGLAGRALALLAAVHQHQALPEGGVEDGLVLVRLHLDADRLEPDGVLLAHVPPWLAEGRVAAEPAAAGRRARSRHRPHVRPRRPPAPGGRPGRRPCTAPCASRAPPPTSRSAARSGC